jgi:hypothetical protein
MTSAAPSGSFVNRNFDPSTVAVEEPDEGGVVEVSCEQPVRVERQETRDKSRRGPERRDKRQEL